MKLFAKIALILEWYRRNRNEYPYDNRRGAFMSALRHAKGRKR